MEVGFADGKDYEYLVANDHHVTSEMIRKKLERNEIIVIRDGKQLLGWLRYGYFCDVIPYMNMLYIEEKHRRMGLGTRLVEFWESEMKKRGYDRVMTSSDSPEQGQHFYRRLGYRDCGALLLPDKPLEIIFLKSLK
jgi:ribosomal protein S18 acetylase RimI-like enzyme